MLHLTHLIDRATGYVFIPSKDAPKPPDAVPEDPDKPTTTRPNFMSLVSTAAGPLKGPSVSDVQERWIDHKDQWDKWERGEWMKEGDLVRDEASRQAAEDARMKS